MATFPVSDPIQGSPLIGSPITVFVVPATHQSAWTFHRVMLKVLAGLVIPDVTDPNYPSDADYTELEFSTPVDGTTQQVQFDISSALRAVADRYDAASLPPSQNAYVKFRIEAWDEWMVDGELHDNNHALLPGSMGTAPNVQLFYFYAFMGTLTDMERLGVTSGSMTMTKWTRKPASTPEVVYIGEDHVRPINYATGLESDHASEGATPTFVSGAPSGGPKSMTYNVGTTAGLVTLGTLQTGRFQVYVAPKPADSYIMRYINRLGCMESLCLHSLTKKTVKINTEQYVIARQETINQFSRSLVVKSGNVEQWLMSSGPLDEQWAAWYMHELLLVEQAWIKVGTTWVACHILPDDSQVLADRANASRYEVQFTLKLDIEGSPSLTLNS